jgi:hypothetical protein
VVAGEAAAVASFLDRFFGVALAAGVALVTAAAALGLGLALCDRFFGLAEATGLGLASWEYASGVAAIANRARSERNVRIKHFFYLDLMLVGNPGSVKKGIFWAQNMRVACARIGVWACGRMNTLDVNGSVCVSNGWDLWDTWDLCGIVTLVPLVP